MTDILNRELGGRLRAAMCDTNLIARQIATRMHISETAMSRTLGGLRTTSRTDVLQFLAICDTPEPDRQRILDLADQDPATRTMRLAQPDAWAALRTHAGTARRVTDIAPLMPPWAAQTQPYLDAIATTLGLPLSGVEQWSRLRVDRAELAGQIGTSTWTILLSEQALHTPVCAAADMADQLDQLLRLSLLPSVSLRLVPANAGAHPGLLGPCTLLDYDDGAAPVVYQDEGATGLFSEVPCTTEQAHTRVKQLTGTALSEEDSRSVIHALAVDLYGAEQALFDEFAIGTVA